MNAAGVAGGGAVHMVDSAEWHRVVDVNLFGTFLAAKHALTQMLEQDMLDGEPRLGGHHRQHRGDRGHRRRERLQRLQRWRRHPDQEHGHRLRRSWHPGQHGLPRFHRHAHDADRSSGWMGMETPRHEIITEHKLGRFGQPEEIASAAAFLLSADASFITGHALVVDGGYTAGRDHGVTEMLGLDGP